MFSIKRVSGFSLSPKLANGRLILIKTIKPGSVLRPGRIVIANQSGRLIIKQFQTKEGDWYKLVGLNQHSQTYFVKRVNIIGRLIWPII